MTESEVVFANAENARVQMRITEACGLYRAAENAGFDPDRCGAARWTCYMLLGAWERAWLESDAIERRGTPDPHRYWLGESWTGKDVLIRCLHGLGDTLQFIRYAALIRQQARAITIEAQPKLKALLHRSRLADTVITWGEPEPEWQVQMEVNELPRVFRSTPFTIPSRVPYLCLEQRREEYSTNGQFRVGLVWSASSFDPTRNIPLQSLKPLFAITGVEFCSLQAGEGWTACMPDGLLNLSGVDTSIEQIAAEMQTLDLILTVDTMNAHLAGALGRRTWTMLPFQCDWRWMTDREDTPWYPTMRLFRQPSPGDWAGVIEQVKAALLSLKQQQSAFRQNASLNNV